MYAEQALDLLKSMLAKETWYFDEIALKDDAYGTRFEVLVSKVPSKEEIEWLFGEYPPYFCGIRVVLTPMNVRAALVRLVKAQKQEDNSKLWTELFDRFEEKEGVKIIENAKKMGVSGLKYAEKHGYVPDLFLLAESMWSKKA